MKIRIDAKEFQPKIEVLRDEEGNPFFNSTRSEIRPTSRFSTTSRNTGSGAIRWSSMGAASPRCSRSASTPWRPILNPTQLSYHSQVGTPLPRPKRNSVFGLLRRSPRKWGPPPPWNSSLTEGGSKATLPPEVTTMTAMRTSAAGWIVLEFIS